MRTNFFKLVIFNQHKKVGFPYKLLPLINFPLLLTKFCRHCGIFRFHGVETFSEALDLALKDLVGVEEDPRSQAAGHHAAAHCAASDAGSQGRDW